MPSSSDVEAPLKGDRYGPKSDPLFLAWNVWAVTALALLHFRTFQCHHDMEAFDSGACGDAFGLKSAGAMAVKTLQVGDPWQKIGSPGRCNCCL